MAKRVVTYLSDEQHEILVRMVRETGSSEADLLRYALRGYMREMQFVFGFSWPGDDPERGGKREGAGRPPKNEGVGE